VERKYAEPITLKEAASLGQDERAAIRQDLYFSFKFLCHGTTPLPVKGYLKKV
jgi:hypothetical protein